jgi:2-C-methyl-D-erythritol 4-phosphate cytidylyltransferase
MADVAVILPAAGSGTRFGAAGNKIFQSLRDRPIFLHTCQAFASRPDVAQLLLVASDEDMPLLTGTFAGALEQLGVTLVPGGRTRAHSVRNALACIDQQAQIVAIHDAVRPCVTGERIDAVIAQARRCGAAILACPVHGTVKRVGDDRRIEQTVSRVGLWQAQTPQVFRRDLLLQAYARDVEGITDDAQAVEAIGQEVRVVPGDPRNLKITTPADLVMASALLETLPPPRRPSEAT